MTRFELIAAHILVGAAFAVLLFIACSCLWVIA